MDFKNILLFQPNRAISHSLLTFRSQPLIRTSSTDSTIKKSVVWLVNGLKNRITEVALAIILVFSTIYCIISFPIRWEKDQLARRKAIVIDLNRFTPEEKTVAKSEVEQYFQKHAAHFSTLSVKAKEELSKQIVSQCARSRKVYAPIVRNWVDHLLETANREAKKLVFMARDGIPFYEVAKELMKREDYQKKYPKLTEEGMIVLGHFSRKVIANADSSDANRNIFKQYIQQLKIKDSEPCIFLDIGFSGSMVNPIRALLPKNPIDFQFLIATTDKAKGFLSNPQNQLSHLATAASNMGVRWLEESHHGTLSSATELVKGEDGNIYPNCLYPKKILCEEKFSLSHLIRKFCLKTLVREALEIKSLTIDEAAKAKEVFNNTIGDIKNWKLPLIVAWDY